MKKLIQFIIFLFLSNLVSGCVLQPKPPLRKEVLNTSGSAVIHPEVAAKYLNSEFKPYKQSSSSSWRSCAFGSIKSKLDVTVRTPLDNVIDQIGVTPIPNSSMYYEIREEHKDKYFFDVKGLVRISNQRFYKARCELLMNDSQLLRRTKIASALESIGISKKVPFFKMHPELKNSNLN
jgi:hypothetical protein